MGRRKPMWNRTTKIVAVAAALVVLAAVGIWAWASVQREPLPLADRCVATVAGNTATVDPDQAYYAGLISGVSVKRGLVPRAASIALATAFQESNLHNLDYGHSDSIGLFQQRPSQGWGTVEEIMDPWYSTTAFYKALVKVKNWEKGDINDIAQAVQRSGFPEAYRQHVDRARLLASALAGETPAAFSCKIASPGTPDAAGMTTFLTKTFGKKVSVKADGTRLVVTADDVQTAWSVAHSAVAGVQRYGIAAVEVGAWTWTHDKGSLAAWHGTGKPDAKVAVLTFPAETPR